MSRPSLGISRRTRSTPLTSRVEARGVTAYTVYNHTLLATEFRGLAEDYRHLRGAVQVWDVGCQRQVELLGPDAARLAQMLTVRDLRKLRIGRCGYAPVCDAEGHLLNDPVVLKLADDRFWFSLSDSDVLLWAAGIALSLGLDVRVTEPDVWPMAVQGPRADDVVAAVLGEAVRDITFFGWSRLPFRGHDLVVARAGWSAQGGVEVYVDDADVSRELYDALMAAGEQHDVRAGCPNQVERIEAGLLSYGTDMTREHTPLEAGLDRYCGLDSDLESIGLDALRRQRLDGVPRRVCGLVLDGPETAGPRDPWLVVDAGEPVGVVSSAAWSPRLETLVALGMLDTAHLAVGTEVCVELADAEARTARVVEVPFPGARNR